MKLLLIGWEEHLIRGGSVEEISSRIRAHIYS